MRRVDGWHRDLRHVGHPRCSADPPREGHFGRLGPYIGNGLSGLGAALEEWGRRGITTKYDRLHTVLGEGNFVLVVSEGHLGGKHTAFYDLFRVENGKIAEHWDTLETILA